MRIAFLGDGRMGHVRRWVSYFMNRGHEVLLFSHEDPSGCLFPHQRMRGYLPTMTLSYLSAMPKVRRKLARFKPDLVNALYAGGYGSCAALSGYPYVVSTLGSDLLIDFPNHPVHRAMIRANLRKAGLVTTDAELLSEIVREAGVPDARILKAYFGVEPEIFFPSSSVTADRRKPRLISTRNLHSIYGLDDLIEAVPWIRAEYQAEFDLCGDGPERVRLELKAEQIATSTCRFYGKLDAPAIAELLRAATIYLSTSRSDSTSVSLLEAMACGAVPVVSDIPANHEWIVEGENGLFYETGKGEDLARAVNKLLSDDALREIMRRRNLEIINERGLWKDNMARVEQAFEKLVLSA
jgi:L-malate glycosyltransferase